MSLLSRFRRKPRPTAADYMLNALRADDTQRELDRALRIMRASGYMAGYLDCTQRLPFSPWEAELIDAVNRENGLHERDWLGLIGPDL